MTKSIVTVTWVTYVTARTLCIPPPGTTFRATMSVVRRTSGGTSHCAASQESILTVEIRDRLSVKYAF
jgi:hypothetical protein